MFTATMGILPAAADSARVVEHVYAVSLTTLAPMLQGRCAPYLFFSVPCSSIKSANRSHDSS